jgi:hypothetical protein
MSTEDLNFEKRVNKTLKVASNEILIYAKIGNYIIYNEFVLHN